MNKMNRKKLDRKELIKLAKRMEMWAQEYIYSATNYEDGLLQGVKEDLQFDLRRLADQVANI